MKDDLKELKLRAEFDDLTRPDAIDRLCYTPEEIRLWEALKEEEDDQIQDADD